MTISADKMMVLQLILLAWGLPLAITVSVGAEDTCINQDAVRTAEYRLKNDLLCNYNKEIRPVKDHTKSLKVGMSMRVLRIIPGEENYGDDTVTVNCILIIFWYDEYLTWSPSDYDSIYGISIAATRIWVPQVILINSALEPPSMPYELNTECQLDSNGHVLCTPKVSLSATCKGDHLKWPFDTQVCKLQFRTLSYTGELLNFTHSGGVPSLPMTKVLGEKNRYWELLSANISTEITGSPINNITFPQVNYRIELKRQSATRAATVIAPAIVMILLTLMSLLLSVESEERMVLLSVNLFCHYLCLQQLIWVVPYNGDTCPLVVLFYRDSLIVTIFVLVTSLLLKNMLKSKIDRLDSLVAIVNQRPVNYIMFRTADSVKNTEKVTEENCNKDEDSSAQTKAKNELETKWKLVVLFADRVQLISVILVYFGLFVSLLTV